METNLVRKVTKRMDYEQIIRSGKSYTDTDFPA